ncbi:carbon-nitrogen hydrolase family protein [Jonesia quinghaiensis]|uniref:carbon-nitrogen hydrolase family protein n=1 Tax=Jonesia quinghaiensis TaxID=262806 RepID=UPI0004242ACF|nr:carbon-nitrogen hydrolase family protein [Jonesia quinghaiensis]
MTSREVPGELTVAAAQINGVPDVQVMADQAREAIAGALANDADLLLLPEYAHYYDPRGVPPDAAQPLDGPYVTLLRDLTHGTRLTVIAGITRPAVDHPLNTLVAVQAGDVIATYDKVHLYDAFGYRESDHLDRGDASQKGIVTVCGFTVGLQTCYDLRFPEITRSRVDAGAHIIVSPAAWVAGPSKLHHWRTLLAARAIENTVVVLAAGLAGRGVCGNSMIVMPDGTASVTAEKTPDLLVRTITGDQIQQARETNPSLENRVYGPMS